ncbi:hypothetical protein DPMN_042707 [Dreissena polymorpha]|uniref:Uncharacterized protein n=1 Tax=Dreissena polymorpha TaxID=45954 RepID=A0A9D4D1A1_DREPO|nr:hypothetical protein DPMN_042707 [Dreissena polymorpha]
MRHFGPHPQTKWCVSVVQPLWAPKKRSAPWVKGMGVSSEKRQIPSPVIEEWKPVERPISS